MANVTPVVMAVLAAELVPAAAFGFASERLAEAIGRWPMALRVGLPVVMVLPYAVIAAAGHIFRWPWFALYAGLPVVMAWLLARAAAADPEQRGNWRDAVILLTLGLAVDLRWFDAAWPAGLRGLGNLLLVDAGLYGFLGVRRLSGVGFDFHLQWSDWKTGLRELLFFAPAVLVLGIALGFIHPHVNLPGVGQGGCDVGGDFYFCGAAGRTFLSRLGTESAGAARGAESGADHCVSAVRAITFQ